MSETAPTKLKPFISKFEIEIKQKNANERKKQGKLYPKIAQQ